jgi:hypothetical protein
MHVDRHIAIWGPWIAGPAFGVAMMAAPYYLKLNPTYSAVAFWGGISVFVVTIMVVLVLSLHNPEKRRRVIGPVLIMAFGALIFCGGLAWYFWPDIAQLGPVAPVPEVPIKPETKAPEKQEKVFVPVELTPERIFSFYQDNTAMQAGEILKSNIGKWTPISGIVRSVLPFNGFFAQVALQRPSIFEAKTPFDRAEIYLHFGESWVDRLAILKHGDKMTAIGQIDRIDPVSFNLRNCEFVDAP